MTSSLRSAYSDHLSGLSCPWPCHRLVAPRSQASPAKRIRMLDCLPIRDKKKQISYQRRSITIIWGLQEPLDAERCLPGFLALACKDEDDAGDG